MATRVIDIENSLWQAADELRANSNLSAQEYSLPVLGLIFLRYADVRFIKAETELKASAGSSRRRAVSKLDYQARGVMYVPDDARFQKLVDEYYDGRTGVDEFFERLLAFAQTLQEEDQRAISEKLNEEELAIYDLLLKPRPKLSKAEVKQVKQVAQEMLATLKEEKLILDWRKKQQARAAVQLAIEEWLDQLPSAYEAPLWEQKVQSVYSHIYDNYYGSGQSVYTRLAVAA